MIGRNPHALFYLHHRHPGSAGQYFGDGALPGGVQVKHQNISHPQGRGKLLEHGGRCFQASSRGANPDDGESLSAIRAGAGL